ncbi:MAG: hypothetical protein KAT30_07330 [Candidatus Krumholzibacteria bacterium]|nr:hypothetical protein [Candidatus Krumholzibacteria bacterium]
MKQLTFILIAATVALMGCNLTDSSNAPVAGDQSQSLSASFGNVGLPGRATVLRLLGTGTAYDGFVPDIDGDGVDDPALCFDVDLLDASGHKIGTATDCLSNIEAVDGGLALVGTTIFNLPNGSFTTRGNTTVQPITTTAATPVTHTTGAIPMDGDNGVIAGTGVYEGFRAQARLSGAVNLSKLDSDGEISFDCLFAIIPLKGSM